MLIVFRCLSVLPLRLLHTLGSALGWVAYFGSSTYRARFQQNVAQAGLLDPALKLDRSETWAVLAQADYDRLQQANWWQSCRGSGCARMCRNNRSFSGKAQNWLTRRWHAARA